MAKKPPQMDNFPPGFTGDFESKAEGAAETEILQKELYNKLYLMFAEARRSLLVILHGIDTAGKDGVISHIFSGANPQGLSVHSFKTPSELELRHDFLWRCHVAIPEAGNTAIFNRSYYEEVSTVKVHPELLKKEHLPTEVANDPDIFKKRYRQINDFEKMLDQNGITIVKILLHISKPEQKRRLEERLKDRTKNWKFSPQDTLERKFWKQYMAVFQKMVDHTHTPHAQWHIVPADNKWYRNYNVSKILVKTLNQLKMKYPAVPASDKLPNNF